MSELTPILINVLTNILEKLKEGTCDLNDQQVIRAVKILNEGDKERSMSKVQMYTALNISRSTFDDYVSRGIIPHGTKIDGFKELCWKPSDLELAILNMQKYNII